MKEEFITDNCRLCGEKTRFVRHCTKEDVIICANCRYIKTIDKETQIEVIK